MHLGIDLGTSNSAVAGVRNGRVGIFKTPEGTDVMPSVIYRDRRGNQSVGVRAYDQSVMSPENVAQGFKRLMGTTTPIRFASTGEAITPEEASAEVLRALVGYALVEAGAEAVTGAVITIPAAFNQMQSEATLAAARAAGLERVALLQEPVAAALAAMANARNRSGLFLVYDLGGGTFDVALVRAIDGDVTVLAHEGINMLGGRDMDRVIVDNLVRPWLLRTFDLPAAFQTEKRYERLLRAARRAAETAKVELSTRDRTTVNASDEVVRLEDQRGEPIYIDVPLDRAQLEALVGGKIDQSIELCRKVLADNGYTHEDVERVVLIGGPTKMPVVRRRVQDELGIEVEDVSRVDPMTAVAVGAAIYCEGRKPTGTTVQAGGALAVSYHFQARTAGTRARLEVRRMAGPAEAAVQVDSLLGWTSGRRGLAEPVVLDLILPDQGPNRFRAFVFDAAGRRVADAEREIMIERLLANAGGVPATQTIAVKVLDDAGRNTLEALVPKGTVLPAKGRKAFRAAETLRAGGEGEIRLELFQVNDDVFDPELSLNIGEFKIGSSDLPDGMSIRRGDEIVVHWEMTEGQTVKAAVEIPSVGQRFENRNFYDYQAGGQSFDGAEGGALVGQVLQFANQDLERAEAAVQDLERADVAVLEPLAAALRPLKTKLGEQAKTEAETFDPDTRRSIAEEARLVRQRIAALCTHPAVRAAILRRRLDEALRWYDTDVRPEGSAADNDRADALGRNARRQLGMEDRSALELAERLIDELGSVYWNAGLSLPGFCAKLWRALREQRHLARNRERFDRLVGDGDRALAAGNFAALRQAIFALWGNRILPGKERPVDELADVTRK